MSKPGKTASNLTFTLTARKDGEKAKAYDLPAGLAIGWILDHLPQEAVTVGFEGDPEISEVAVFRVDWRLVPPEIRQGAAT